MAAELAGALVSGGAGMGSDIPNGLHRKVVDSPDLGQRERLVALVLRLDRLVVHPLRNITVTLDLQVLAQLLVADRTTLGQSCSTCLSTRVLPSIAVEW